MSETGEQAENSNPTDLVDTASNMASALFNAEPQNNEEQNVDQTKQRTKHKRKVKKRVTKEIEETDGDLHKEEEHEYQYEYEYFYSEEEKPPKKKGRKYRHRPRKLIFSEAIYHLDVPYSDSNPTSPHTPTESRCPTNSPRKHFSKTMKCGTPLGSVKGTRSLPRLARTLTPRSSNSEIDGYVKKALNKEPILNVTDECYGDIIFELSERRKKTAREHNYAQGDRLTEAIQFVEECQITNQKNLMASDFKKNFEDEKKEFDEKLSDFDKQTQSDIEELKQKHIKQHEELMQIQRQERDKHREKWTSEWMVRQYNKSSTQLNILRKQHTLLLCQNRFKEAEVVNQQIQQRNKMEEDNNSKAYQTDYDNSVKMLKEKQQIEEDHFRSQCDVELQNYKVKRSKLRRGMEYKAIRLEHKGQISEDPDKIWNQSMLQRVENQASIQEKRSAFPSTKMTKGDLGDKDVQALKLPKLKLDVEKEDRASKRRNDDVEEAEVLVDEE